MKVRTFAQSTVFGLLALLLIGCTTPQLSHLGSGTTARPGAGYVYGRFASHHSALGFQLSLGLTNLDTGAEAAILVPHRSKVAVVALPPGTYQARAALLQGLPLSTGWGHESETPVGAGDFDRPFRVEPGEACYIGDYRGRVFFAGVSGMSYDYMGTLEPATNNFSRTTEEFRRLYPRLEAIPVRSIGTRLEPQKTRPRGGDAGK